MPVKKLFLSVGAMKAGTTFLYNVFREHPELYFTPEKELHYFAHANGLSRKLQRPLSSTFLNTFSSNLTRKHGILTSNFRRHRLSMVMHNRFSKIDDVNQLREIVKWYADKYLTEPINDTWFDRVFSEAGNRYACDFSNYHALLSAKGWSHVKRTTEKLRVIYVLREPVARLWSHIKFDLMHSGRKGDIESIDLKQLKQMLASTGISSHSRYGDIVTSLKRNLSSEQLKIIAFEQFVEDFDSTVREVEDFLEIEHFEYKHVDINKKSNPSVEMDIDGKLRETLFDAVYPEIVKLKNLGIVVPNLYENNDI